MINFRELEIWKRSFDLVNTVYEFTLQLPDNEKFGLTSQIRRCAVSMPSNIAEGCSRTSNKEIARFLEIALGSSFELETQMLIAYRRKMLKSEQMRPTMDELNQIQKMISAFRSHLLRN